MYPDQIQGAFLHHPRSRYSPRHPRKSSPCSVYSVSTRMRCANALIQFIIAASLTNYSCTYVCSLCANGPGAYDQGYGYYVQINDLSCDCYFATDTIGFLKRSEVTVRSDSPGVLFDRSTSRRLGATVNKGITRATKQGLDSAMMCVLLCCFLLMQ